MHADREDSIRALFSWAEHNYPHLFSPAGANLQTYDVWTYVYYPNTNTYAGVNTNNEVAVLGDVFGGLLPIDTLENLLSLIGYQESGNTSTGSSGNGGGNCVNVMQIANGSRIVTEIVGPGGGTVHDRTFSNVSANQFTMLEISTSDLLNSRSEILVTFDLTVSNNMAYINSIKGTGESNVTGLETYSFSQEYTPAKAVGPAYVFCQGDAWTEPSVTETFKRNDDVMIRQTEYTQGIVNSVNEVITVPAGQFPTVKITTTTNDTIHSEWLDINTGHNIKIEEYDNDGATPTFRWGSQATLVQ